MKNLDAKLTLVTNLKFTQTKNFRLECNAILIEENVDGLFSKQTRVRGFGMEGAWPAFSMWLPLETRWEFVAADSRNTAVVMGEEGAMKPLFSGSLLKLSNGEEFYLQTSDDVNPIEVEDVTHFEYPAIWERLERKTIQYWTAPNRPVLTYVRHR